MLLLFVHEKKNVSRIHWQCCQIWRVCKTATNLASCHTFTYILYNCIFILMSFCISYSPSCSSKLAFTPSYSKSSKAVFLNCAGLCLRTGWMGDLWSTCILVASRTSICKWCVKFLLRYSIPHLCSTYSYLINFFY